VVRSYGNALPAGVGGTGLPIPLEPHPRFPPPAAPAVTRVRYGPAAATPAEQAAAPAKPPQDPPNAAPVGERACPVTEPPAPEPAPVSATVPCDVCGLPVTREFVERTGQRRHGHHDAPKRGRAGADRVPRPRVTSESRDRTR
jgi:hypothetical protein